MIIHIEPTGKPRMTRKGTHKPAAMRYWAYKDTIKAEIYRQKPNLKNVIGLSWTAYFTMPRSWTKKKKRELKGQLHFQVPDRDNIDKGILDAIFKNDSHIATGTLEKRWDDGNGGRLELEFIYAQTAPE